MYNYGPGGEERSREASEGLCVVYVSVTYSWVYPERDRVGVEGERGGGREREKEKERILFSKSRHRPEKATIFRRTASCEQLWLRNA